MPNRRSLVAYLVAGLSLAALPTAAFAQEKLPVVASFSVRLAGAFTALPRSMAYNR